MTTDRVVIDTNVIVSGILSANNYPARIVNTWLEGERFQPILSEDLKREVTNVLNRPKIKKRLSRAVDLEILLPALFKKATLVSPKKIKNQVFTDEGDHFLLELAVSGEAKVIVTGDEGMLKHGSFEGLILVNPRQFCERYEI